MFTTSNYQELYWPPANTNDIALLQVLVADTPLMLNGRFSNERTYKNVDFSYNNKMNASVVRRLTFTSAQDMSGTNFVIYGRQNNVDITESIVGPNNNTATSVNYYDYIYKIEHTGTVLGSVSIGTNKDTGFFTLTTLDVKNYRKSFEYGINLVIDSDATTNVSCNIYGSLNRKKGLYENLISKKYFYELLDAATTMSKFFDIKTPTALILIKVLKNDNNRPLRAQILQI